jgi:hypothetical protein
MTIDASDGALLESRSADVFLSYARADRDYVRRLARRLAAAGLSPWYDKGLTPGGRWSVEIERNIAKCAAFVVVVSPSATASAWVERELNLAERLGKPILPLQLGSTDWWRLADLQVVRVDRNEMPGPYFVDRLRHLSTPPVEGGGTETMPTELAVIAAQLERGDLEGADATTAALIAGGAGGPPIVTVAALDRLPDDLLTMLCWIYRTTGGISLRDRPFVVNDAFGADGRGLSATSARSGRSLLFDRLETLSC